jgi:hypothetical protein
MLLAEIHGKRVPEARDSEDYLTSAVFGHLRYVPPTVFWLDLVAQVRAADGRHALDWFNPAKAVHLEVDFWRRTPFGEPDLLLVFTFPEGRVVTVVVEVKLWASKSGVGEADQLVRYLRYLDTIVGDSFLVYLTPRDPTAELQDSLQSPKYTPGDETRLFGLTWQSLQDVARRVGQHTDPPFDRLLSDVAAFLDQLGLARFDGWKVSADCGDITPTPAAWAGLFRQLPDFPFITPTPARWTHGR